MRYLATLVLLTAIGLNFYNGCQRMHAASRTLTSSEFYHRDGTASAGDGTRSVANEFYVEPRYKIAIIDTGYDPSRAVFKLKLCKTGHYDYLTKTSNVNFFHEHGTRVADIIAEKLKDVEYCAIIYQMYTTTEKDGPHAELKDEADAINMATGERVTAINLSFSGPDKAPEEIQALDWATQSGVTIFIAAGNEHKNLNYKCDVYPACHKFNRMIVVGMQDYDEPKKHDKDSNYGRRVDVWAPGYSFDKEDNFEHGTSFAAPRALADYILFLEHKRLAHSNH